MRRAIFLLIVLGVAGVVVYLGANFNLMVRLEVGEWLVETRLMIALLALMALFVLVWLLLKSGFGLWNLPDRLKHMRLVRGQKLGLLALSEVVENYASGRLRRALLAAARARKQLPDPGLGLAVEGWLAQQKGDDRAALTCFNMLRRQQPDSMHATRGLIEITRQRKDRVSALAQVNEALKKFPQSPWLLRTAFELHAEQGQWESVGRYLDALDRLGERDSSRRAMVLMMLGKIKEERNRLDEARQLYQQALKHDGKNVHLLLAFGDLWIRLEKVDKGVAMWRDGYLQTGFPLFLERILRHFADAPLKAVTLFEELLTRRSDAYMILYALARATIAARMWGRAKELILRLESFGLERLVLPLSAELMLRQELDRRSDHDPAFSKTLEAQGLLLKSIVVSCQDWRCSSCFASTTTWQPTCPECGHWDSLKWAGLQ